MDRLQYRGGWVSTTKEGRTTRSATMIVTAKQNNENSRTYALRILKQNLVSLDLEPGSLLSEKDLAVEMGLSRTPVDRKSVV